ncbi:MAG: DUF4340 domain-containing protein, partial [Planctomycetota bacterium]
MKNTQLNQLAVVALLMLAAAWLVNRGETGGQGGFVRGSVLIQGLEPAKVESVVVASKDKTVTLNKKGSRFLIQEKDQYPASIAKINELIRKVTDITLREEVTASSKSHAALGVTEGGEDAVSVTFKDAVGKTLVGIVKGKAAETGGGGPHVRRVDQDQVYLAEKSVWLNTDPADYLEKDLFGIERDEVMAVTVTIGKEKPYSIV